MKKALVVIDVQNYFMNDYTKEIPGKVADYIREKGKEFDQVVFFSFLNNENTAFYKFYGWKDMTGPPETDLCPEIEEVSNQNMFVKDTRSCLKNEKFKKFLEDNEIGELYLCGLNTEECILSTAYDGFDCGFNIFIIKNLCSSKYSMEAHENGLRVLKEAFEVI